MQMVHTHPFIFHAVVRWTEILGLVLLFGGVVFHLWMFRSATVGRYLSCGSHHLNWRARFERKTKHLLILALLFLTAGSGMDLLLRTQMMSGQPLYTVFPLLPSILSQTHFGLVWKWKVAVLAICWGLIAVRSLPWFLGLGAGAFGLLVALSGHATQQGWWSRLVVSDWVHILSASAWVGGICFLLLLTGPALGWINLEKEQTRRVLCDVVTRFSTLAATCVLLLSATGVINVLAHIHSPHRLVTTLYGGILLTKMVLVAGMLSVAAITRFSIVPRLRDINTVDPSLAQQNFSAKTPSNVNGVRPDETILRRTLLRLAGIEAVFALAVIGCAAMLTLTSPPHD